MHDIMHRIRTKKQDEGFTLIELLVVVVIIGVLVAIAVPVFLNYRKGAADKSAQSDMRNAIAALELAYSSDNNQYPGGFTNNGPPTVGIGNGQSITLSDKSLMTYVPVSVAAAPALSYLLCATNTGGSGKVYFFDSAAGGSVKESNPKVNMATCKV